MKNETQGEKWRFSHDNVWPFTMFITGIDGRVVIERKLPEFSTGKMSFAQASTGTLNERCIEDMERIVREHNAFEGMVAALERIATCPIKHDTCSDVWMKDIARAALEAAGEGEGR